MRLQLALDVLDLKKALNIAEKTRKYVDIIEMGTPFIKKYGINIIKKFKKFKKPILADLKTMDTGFLEAELAFKAGAEITTVCAGASDFTIKGAIKAGRRYGKSVVVDLIGVKNKLKRTKEIMKLKPDYFCVHTAIDEQKKGKDPLKELKEVNKLGVRTEVAGGINLNTIEQVVKLKPEIVVVGGAITKSKNPEKVAKKLKEAMA